MIVEAKWNPQQPPFVLDSDRDSLDACFRRVVLDEAHAPKTAASVSWIRSPSHVLLTGKPLFNSTDYLKGLI